MSPVPATPSEPQLCPVLPCVSSTALQADSSWEIIGHLILNFSSFTHQYFFLPLSCIPPQPLTFPNFSNLSFSSQNTPRGFSLLPFVLFSGILHHPGPPAPTPVPHSEWGEQIQSFPGCCLIHTQLCVSISPLPCGVAGFSKPWQAPSTSYWLRVFLVVWFVCFLVFFSCL